MLLKIIVIKFKIIKMNIEAKEFELKMTYGELWSIAFDV